MPRKTVGGDAAASSPATAEPAAAAAGAEVPAAIARAKVAAKAAARTDASNGAAPPRRPKLSFRERLGDGVWLIVLGAVLLPGVAILLLDPTAEYDPSSPLHPTGCASLYYFVCTFCLSLALLIAMHLLVHFAPRPVSHVDRSPASATIAAVVILAPPVLALWSITILLWPARVRNQCSFEGHQALWVYFGTLVAAGALALALFTGEMARVLFRALLSKQEVAPAHAEAGTFTTEAPRLDNAQWLAMEGRRLREQAASGSRM